MWTVPLIACDHFYMRDVNICSFWFPNRDAVDLCDCHHVLVENCSFLSDDDVVYVLFSDIFIEKLRKSHGSYIGGLYQDGKEYRLNNICFRRVKARFKGGLKHCPDCPAEYDRPLYPEDSMFGEI